MISYSDSRSVKRSPLWISIGRIDVVAASAPCADEGPRAVGVARCPCGRGARLTKSSTATRSRLMVERASTLEVAKERLGPSPDIAYFLCA
jgi:hypothetical protein